MTGVFSGGEEHVDCGRCKRPPEMVQSTVDAPEYTPFAPDASNEAGSCMKGKLSMKLLTANIDACASPLPIFESESPGLIWPLLTR